MYKCLTCNEVDKDLKPTSYIEEYAYNLDEFLKLTEKDFPTLDWQYTNKAHTTYHLKDNCITFDIETSKVKETESAFMYIAQFCIFGKVVFVRTWEEVRQLLDFVKKTFKISKSKSVSVFVHNLSYEYAFANQFLNVDYNKVFATDSHDILYFNTKDGFEFRCSYRLTMEDLAHFIIHTPTAKHFKGKEDLDYNVLRTPTTELSPLEYGYCYNDVKGLYEAVMYRIQKENGGGVCSLPYTSTGYVRREFKQIAPAYQHHLKKIKINRNEYNLLKECFRGGNTASNIKHVNNILENVSSYDITSSYPYIMCGSNQFPMGKFRPAQVDTLSDLNNYNKEYATMGIYRLRGVHVKKHVPVPYISSSKCMDGSELNFVYNGRVVDSDVIYIALTNVDYNIIINQYDIEGIQVTGLEISEKGYLPEEFRELVFSYFEKKTQLKGIDEYQYDTVKKLLNACYGMMVTALDKFELVLNITTGCYEQGLTSESDAKEYYKQLDRKIKQAYDGKEAYCAYQWGVWVAALARQRLQEMLDIVGDDVVYCDTDSVKFINGAKHNKEFAAKNEALLKDLEDRGLNLTATNSTSGKSYTLGTWGDENLKGKDFEYYSFITLGAKKYAFVTENKKGEKVIGVTVAGLGKKQGAKELTKGNGLDDFHDGKVFYDSGRTTAKWNYVPRGTIVINGEKIETASNIYIEDTTYTLSYDKGKVDQVLEIILK